MRHLILLFLVITNLNSLKAQHFEVGGNLSLNTSWILNQNASKLLEAVCPEDPLIIGSEPGYAITLGYSIGAVAAYDSESFWSVGAELNYTKRGQNYKDSWINNGCGRGDINNFKRNFTLHYFEVPLIVKFRPRGNAKIKGYGEIGVQMGFLIGAKEKISIAGENQVLPLVAAKSKVKTFDLGVVLGGGIDIEFTNNLYVNVGARTYFGFFDLNKGDAANFISANDNVYQASRNFSLGLNVGIHYIFDWKGSMYYRR